VSDLLARARSVRSGFSGEISELSERSLLEGTLSSHLSLLSQPNRVPLRRKRRRKRIPRIPCATCGLSPTDTYEDGSPRYDHGHDPKTGEVWWAQAEVASVRRCPACSHEHPVLTTCLGCEECQALDLTAIATEVFADLLPGGVEWRAALVRHNQNLGSYGRCDGDCHLDDCRRPYYDESGLTRYRDTSVEQSSVPVFGQHQKR